MNPAAVLLIAEALLRYGPGIARQLHALFSKTTPPTMEDWDNLFKAVETKSYDDYVRAPAPPV